MKYDYFIIGNSAAAVGCIEGIRRESKNGKICVVTDENYRAYGRPLISCGERLPRKICLNTDQRIFMKRTEQI